MNTEFNKEYGDRFLHLLGIKYIVGVPCPPYNPNEFHIASGGQYEVEECRNDKVLKIYLDNLG